MARNVAISLHAKTECLKLVLFSNSWVSNMLLLSVLIASMIEDRKVN